jgi:hypothetical protein
MFFAIFYFAENLIIVPKAGGHHRALTPRTISHTYQAPSFIHR